MSTVTNGETKMTDLTSFDEMFPLLVQVVTNSGFKGKDASEAAQWFKRVCEYNVPFGKKNRGMIVVHSYEVLKQGHVSDGERKLAIILGWCIEFLQAFFLVADDVMDHSTTRRGQACWYKNSDVGLEAINDSFFLESAIYVILKHFFRDRPYYVDLLELFHEVTLQTVTGQCLDMVTAPQDGPPNFDKYTLQTYRSIVKWKTSFYSFYLPVACALHMAGIKDVDTHKAAEKLLLQIGEYFQIQDDYLDCYGDPMVTGKIGTDIEDNKCSWLIVQALARADDRQREIITDNYAQKDPERVARVKQVYNELGLKGVFEDYETTSYEQILKSIEALDDSNLPQQLFLSTANMIYKRRK